MCSDRCSYICIALISFLFAIAFVHDRTTAALSEAVRVANELLSKCLRKLQPEKAEASEAVRVAEELLSKYKGVNKRNF